MAQTSSLASRIDAEFSAVEERTKKFQSEQLEKNKGREKRLAHLGKIFDELQEIWRPRLDLLVKKFGDRVKATPRIVPATREVTFDVQSPLATVRLKFSAFTDRDIEKLHLTGMWVNVPRMTALEENGFHPVPSREGVSHGSCAFPPVSAKATF